MKKTPEPGVGYFPSYHMSQAEIEDQKAKFGEQTGQKHKPKHRSKRFKWTPRMLVMIFCAAVFVVSAGLLINYYTQIYRARDATSQLRELYVSDTFEEDVPEPEMTDDAQAAVVIPPAESEQPVQTAQPTKAPSPAASAAAQAPAAPPATVDPELAFSALWPTAYADNPLLRIDDSFQNLRRQNRDIVGWLSIDGVLDEPVLQKDNQYYLTHDSTGAKNVTGALFLDETCNLRTLSNNLIIHGHNMKEGAMFGSLKKYKVKDAEFYKAHPYITFNTLYEKAQYVIFAVAEISIKQGGVHYLPFWQYVDFWDQSDFDGYIKPLKAYSHFQTKVDVQPGDRMLTLATCSGSDNSARLLVVARKLRDNEDTIALSQGILSTISK